MIPWVAGDVCQQRWVHREMDRLTPRVFPNDMLRAGDLITKVNDAARPVTVMEALTDATRIRLLVVCRLGD